MPSSTAIAALEVLKKYNSLIDSLNNFNNWGLQVQTMAATLQADVSYLTVFTVQERTALTNFLNSINSIIPINNIPSKAE